MKTLTNVEYNLAVEICARFEQIGMFEDDKYEFAPGVEYYCGATRMCYSTDELPGWVIKVDFSGTHFDHTAREAENYKDAVAEGLGDFFASTYKIYECEDGRAVCVQEEVSVDSEAVTDSWYTYTRDNCVDCDDLQEALDNGYEESEYVWDVMNEMEDWERVEAIYGFNEKLEKFISSHHINDLHEGNWGESEYSGIIMMDYAGYGF